MQCECVAGALVVQLTYILYFSISIKGTYLLGMILHLRFDGHWVFAGVYETAAHYYALHLVRHLEATVVWVVELYGVVSLTRRSCRELEFEIRAKHARLRPHVTTNTRARGLLHLQKAMQGSTYDVSPTF